MAKVEFFVTDAFNRGRKVVVETGPSDMVRAVLTADHTSGLPADTLQLNRRDWKQVLRAVMLVMGDD